MAEFRAKEWLDPDGVIVASGERLARQVLPALRRGEQVIVRADGLAGLSSSYFNIFFNIIRDELGPDALSMVEFDCISPTLRTILERSLSASMNVSR
jgi:hypothetical protein